MNTIIRLANLGITIEASDAVIAEITAADKFSVSRDDVKAMSHEERSALRSAASDEMEAYCYDAKDNEALYNAARACYWLIADVENEEYREENMAEFKAYEARMNEPDFDWGYYSDWHKDMFGYRPHFRAIPANDKERDKMCEAWHRARGL